jgi:hypothetical protein
MNLLSESRSLSEKILNLSESASREQIIRSIQPIEDELVKAVGRLTTIALTVEHFSSETSMDFVSVEYSFTSVRKKLEPVRKALGDKPEEALQRNRWANCDASVKAMIRDLEQGLQSAWKGFIGKMSHDIGNLEPFLELGDGARGIREIKSKQDRLTAYEKSLPPDEIESCISTVKALSLEIGEQVGALDLGDLPDGVSLFIKRVKSFNGATLADLDLEVFEWLKTKDMLKSFKVK